MITIKVNKPPTIRVAIVMGGNSYSIAATDVLMASTGTSWTGYQYEGEEIQYEFLTTNKEILGRNYFEYNTEKTLEFIKYMKLNYDEVK